MARLSQPSGSSIQVLQTLAWCRKSEFRPVPLHPQSKAAIYKKFIEPSYSPPPDSFWQTGNFGIGVVLGPSHSGPVDIDLDCPEALFFAPYFLPPTPAVFGRVSKPASHFLYRVQTPVTTFALRDPLIEQDSNIVELRADGGSQTVMPGSLHQDTGELIEWSNVPFPDVPVVDLTLLSNSVKLLAIAVLCARYFWQDGQRNEMVKHLAGIFFYLELPIESIEKLVDALDDFHQSHDKTHGLTVAATYKKGERGGKIVGATSLRKFIQPVLVDKLLEWLGSPVVGLLQEYNERFATVRIGGRFRVVDTSLPGDGLVFMQKDDFMNYRASDCIVIEDKLVPKAKLWLSNPRHRAYDGADFIPGVEDPVGILNLWTGWGVQPKAGKCEAWLTLLKDVVCGGDSDLTEWMLNWFANILREPRNRSMTAPVLIGRQGAGKSLLLAYFGCILGDQGYTVITNEEHIYGRFNQHLATTLLLHSEEALYGGELKHRGIIKSLITDQFRIFEPKGVDAKQVRNYLRLVLTSNLPHAAPAEAGDRRFTVVDLDNRIISDQLRVAVVEEMHGEGPAALFQHLLDLDYKPDLVRINVKNEALANMKAAGGTPLEVWWRGVLMSGYILPEYLSWAQKPKLLPWVKTVSSSALYTSMVINLRDRGVRQIPNPELLAQHLNKFIGTKLNRQRQLRYENPKSDDAPLLVQQLPDKHYSINNLPDLTACRSAFEVYLGQPVDWPEDEPEHEKPLHERF